jgi:maltose alpha-D-glucosyltransferase/alpha-amylase
MAADDMCRDLLAAIESTRQLHSRRGTIRAWPTRVFSELRAAAGESPAIRRGSAEQSNSSIFYGGRLMLKLYRRLEPGVNPDLEIGRYLTEQAGFDRIPLCCGAIEYAGGGNEPQTTALLQAAVDNQGDGWQWTLEELGRYYEDCSALGEQDVVRAPITRQRDDRAVAAGMGLSLESAATLGRRTAELHQALASGPDNPAFSPEPFTDDDLANILAALRADVENSLDMLQENVSRLPDDAAGYAAQALERREALMNRFGRMETFTVAAAKIRIHGDYHL